MASGFPAYGPGEAPHPIEGFLVQATRPLPLDGALAYFQDACHFAETANAMTTAAEVIEVLSDAPGAFEAVVRTGFALPWPLQDREFLHYVTTHRTADAEGHPQAIIAYASVAETGLPPAWPGYLRCPMRPSGQRLTQLEDGQLRLEHCMTYDLVGAIPGAVQNALFHRGHRKAYADEWVAAMTCLAEETGSASGLAAS